MVSPQQRSQGGQSVVEFALVLPIMLIVLLAIVDFARIYTTMLSIESAAREAADYGTTLGAEQWSAAKKDVTVTEMQKRACVASSNLPDYVDADADPSNGCTNPGFGYCLTSNIGGACEPFDPAAGCDDPDRAVPCTVTVSLAFDFRLLAPFSVELFGSRIGLPSTIGFERDSTFSMTDVGVVPPTPGP